MHHTNAGSRPYNRFSGFSLIELAIVLVVAGILVGGVLAGRHLLQQGKGASIVTDAEEIQRAMVQFMATYNAIPGDMPNADERLGALPNTPTLNGNGNGMLDDFERPLVWQHLALAGLIKGEYDGTSDAIGSGSKASKYGRDVAVEMVLDPTSGAVSLSFGRVDGATRDLGFLSPEEAQQLIRKYDDGNPNSGRIRAVDSSDGEACLTATGQFAVGTGSRGCRIIAIAEQLDPNSQMLGDMGADDADDNRCPDGLLEGQRTGPFPCSRGKDGQYFMICRGNGVMEIDPTDFTCEFPPCPATVETHDGNGHRIALNASNVGTYADGTCMRPDGITPEPYLDGYNDSDFYDLAQQLPQLACMQPGGTEGWRRDASAGDFYQQFRGKCDTICYFAGPYNQIPASANVDAFAHGPSNQAFFQTQGITPYHHQVRVQCRSGYSDAALNDNPGNSDHEEQILTCQRDHGDGYTNITLQCRADCAIASLNGWNASRMNINRGTKLPDLATHVRHGSTATITCQTGFSHGQTLYDPVLATCNNGSWSYTLNGVPAAGLPACYQTCNTPVSLYDATRSVTFQSSGASNTRHGSIWNVQCNTGGVGSSGWTHGYATPQNAINPENTPVRCNDGTWVDNATSGATKSPDCRRRCSGSARATSTQSCTASGCSCGASSGSRTCNATSGAWGGCSSTCNACPPPPPAAPTCGCHSACAGGGNPHFGWNGFMYCGCYSLCSDGTCHTWSNPVCSDRRLKHNLKLSGYHDSIPVYEFSYLNDSSQQRYIGVMAQDVLHIPHAVNYNSEQCGGYMSVNYDRLGFTFSRKID